MQVRFPDRNAIIGDRIKAPADLFAEVLCAEQYLGVGEAVVLFRHFGAEHILEESRSVLGRVGP